MGASNPVVGDAVQGGHALPMLDFVRLSEEPDLQSHLEELRTRILYALLALAVGLVAGWLLYPYAYALVARPVLDAVQAVGGQVVMMQPTEAFFTQMNMALALGLLFASPVVIWQLWAFVRPGLLPRERRAVAPLVPAVSLLFIAGAALAYVMLPNVLRFVFGYTPHGVGVMIGFQYSITFPVKMMVAFGLAFQLPIVLLGLVWLDILTPESLLHQWRAALLTIAGIAAVVTPTGDPFNWSLVLVPLILLYFGTVAVAFSMKRKRTG